MEIEAELPDDFDQLPDSEKVEELDKLISRIDDTSDSGKLKKRILEELKRNYSS